MSTKTLRQRALELLARREYARSELATRLTPYAPSEAVLQTLLNELSLQGWQSDERFAEAYARTHANKYGKRYIMAVLRQRGIEDSILDTLVFADDYATAFQLWQKRFGKPPESLGEKAKQARFLMSHGFDARTIAKIIYTKGLQDDEAIADDLE